MSISMAELVSAIVRKAHLRAAKSLMRSVPFWALIFTISPLHAQTFKPTFSIGAGIQTNYDHSKTDGADGINQFPLDHLRLYFSGDVNEHISAMVNTDYQSSNSDMQVLDAVGQFHVSPKVNVWFGRFLPPSDRG